MYNQFWKKKTTYKRLLGSQVSLPLPTPKSNLTCIMCLKDCWFFGSQILASAEFQWESALRSSAWVSRNRTAIVWFSRTHDSLLVGRKVVLRFPSILLSLKLSIGFWRFSMGLSSYNNLLCGIEKDNSFFLRTIFLLYSFRPGMTKRFKHTRAL